MKKEKAPKEFVPPKVEIQEDVSPNALAALRGPCQEYAQKKDEKDRLEAELTALNKELDDDNKELVALFEKAGIKNVKLEGLGTFFCALDVRPKVVDEEALHKQLRKEGMEALIKQSVPWATLRAAVKERREQGKADFKGIEVFELQQVRLRRK